MVVKSAKYEAPRLIPERFETYSVLLRCVHHHAADSQVKRSALDTKCPAQVRISLSNQHERDRSNAINNGRILRMLQIIACLKKDDASGAWHVSIVQQVANHNHTVSKSLYACYTQNSPHAPPHQAAAADADVIDLTEDRVTSKGTAHKQQTSDVNPLDATSPALQASNTPTPTSRNEVYVEEEEEDTEDLGRCESNDEATEVEQLDHLIRVRPMRQRVFSDWNAVSDYLAAYTRATHQVGRLLRRVDSSIWA